MVIPKILLVSSTFIYAPFLFPIAYVFEYLLIIGYNKLITGSANGKWIFFVLFVPEHFCKAKFDFKYDVGLDRTGNMSFLTRQDWTPKFARQILPDQTESGLIFSNILPVIT